MAKSSFQAACPPEAFRIMLVMLLLAALGAPAFSAGSEKVLRVAGIAVYSGRSNVDEMVDMWRQEFKQATGTELQFVDEEHGDVSTNQQKTSILARMSSIDVAAVDTIHVHELEEHVAPFDHAPYLPALRSEMLRDELETHRSHDGRQLAIPWYRVYGLLYYRIDLLDKYNIPHPSADGWTFEEMEAIALRVQREERSRNHHDFHGFVWTGQTYEGLTCMVLEVLAGEGGEFVDADGGVHVDNEALARAVERMSSWIWGNGTTEGISPTEVLSFREADLRRRFCEIGNAMFTLVWSSFFADCDKDGMAGRYGVTSIPGRSRRGGHGILGGQALVVSKHTQMLKEAQEFVRMSTSRRWQLQYFLRSQRDPVRNDLVGADLPCDAVQTSCRIDLHQLSNTSARLPRGTWSQTTPSIIISTDSGLCGEVAHVATVCDINTTGYILKRPSDIAGPTYAAVSSALQAVIHEALVRGATGTTTRTFVREAMCAVTKAGRSADGPFWSKAADGTAARACEHEADIICDEHQYNSNGKCVVCAMHQFGGCSDKWGYVVMAFPLAAVGAVALVYIYLSRTRGSADAMWKVELSELTFGHPAEVLGRGTFGLVLKAEYRGTAVAVKRVIPPGRTSPFCDTTAEAQEQPYASACAIKGCGTPTPRRMLGPITPRSPHVDLMVGTPSHCSVDCGTPMRMQKTPSLGSRVAHAFRSTAISQRQQLRQDFIREMRLLSKLRHPCVLTVMGAVVSRRSEPMLVMELMEHGSLYDLLHNETMVMDSEMILPILRDIMQGLRFLHAAQPVIVHGDLKSANVLVDRKFRAKVADFGLSQKSKVGACGTPLWMAPELLRGESNTAASDVYAFGIVLSEVYTREDPYSGQDTPQVLSAVADPDLSMQLRPEIPPSVCAEVAVLMNDCWQGDSSLRPACEEIDRRLKSLDISAAEGKPTLPILKRSGSIGDANQPKVQRRTSHDILHDVFPKHIAEALRHGRKVEPEHRDVVTIFFSDIVGFTDISATLAPERVSMLLDRLYSKFDRLSDEHGIFKVETIGDAYMAVANLVEEQWDDHAKRIALFAKAALEAANETEVDPDCPEMGCLNIRVGFHSGPVVASVVGTRNLRYCLFGDTVNTASRMESASEKGRIHCSAQAAKHLVEQAPTVPLLPRGNIAIKGKGDMYTYWVFESDTEAKS